MATWLVERGIQTCRECCGGHGSVAQPPWLSALCCLTCVCRYHAANRFGSLRGDVDVFLTFEGCGSPLTQV
jgi:hypothetical protein